MKYNSEIPGPKDHWLWGSLFEFAKDPIDFFLRTAREYPALRFFRDAGYCVYLVSDPKLIDELLIGQHKKLHKDVVTRGPNTHVSMGQSS
ncbi:MAG TPA: hypothetical protein EYN06_05270 [Myxococcales bacterium]|nr:hypothetical protein [Myxococcales bacterium]HIN85873.1 hypothetical protein [Myxococcales bacterium]